jgi:hypothetical protein
MATISFDPLNVYVLSKIPTNNYLKIFIFILNIGAFVGICYFIFQLQEDKPNILPFILPVLYAMSIGKYLLWNTFGEESYIISTSHISFQHCYGFWTTNLKTTPYKFLIIDEEGKADIHPDDMVHLIFLKFTAEKLQEEAFKTTLTIKYAEALKILAQLNELNIDELGEAVNFPKIFSN